MTESSDLSFAAHASALRSLWDRETVRFGFEAVVLYAGSRHPMFLDDRYYPFRINPHFQHWVPLQQPVHSAVVLRPGQKPRLHLFAPVDYWESNENDVEEYWARQMDVQTFDKKEDLARALGDLPPRTAWIGEDPAFDLCDDWISNPPGLLNAIHYARAIKTDYEKDCLRGAARLAVTGHKAAEQAFRDGKSEFEIHLAFLAAVQQTEPELPYQPIICLNENAACLHYRAKNRQRIAAADLRSFLIDAGATCRGYLSDVTRTHAATAGIFSDLIAAVDRMQQTIVEAAKPGVSYVDLNRTAHSHLATILRDTRLVDMEPEAMVDSGVTWTFLPHGLGHFIGLQVHDVGGHMASPKGDLRPPPSRFPHLRLTRTLEAGHALTIEPGLYFIPELLKNLKLTREGKYINWAAIDAILPYGGIRVEDNILIAADGPENMTRNAGL